MKKVKVLSIIAIVLFAMQPLQSQNIEHFYVGMPNVLNPILTQQQRFELLEFFKADMGDSITNRFGTQTRILALDTLNNHILTQNTDISTFEMKMIVANADTIIGIIRTVCAPICQSTIEFYNTRWKKRENIQFTFPEAAEWINAEKLKESGFNPENVRNALNTSFISLSFNPETSEIRATNNSLEFLDEREREKITPLMNEDAFVYRYERGKWVR